MPAPSHIFCVAPMMDWTDRHCRYFLRLLSKHAMLYTEMVTTGALIHGDKARFLKFNPEEQPLAIQLGGSNPKELAECAKLAEDAGYLEVNLNIGCPSDRVQNGKMGACLMAEPELVAECVAAMKNSVKIPVTVKSRIGIDDMDSYDELADFISVVSSAGCSSFILHARIAILKGLSPKQNRDIPPLNYQRVYDIKRNFPDLEIIINGGIKSLTEAHEHLQHVDGVMLGREAYQHPYILSAVDQEFFNLTDSIPERLKVLEYFLPYVADELKQGTALRHITRHILGLFQSQPGGKKFRRYLSENAYKPGADLSILEHAMLLVQP
ncbi:MAG: tRNA dihydrouridine(20/20a) synthase DusA [SAR86 cluster bacterium]|uniref:tRNA-dihydrouridine(20/20a) synthase n=1 Tax=SAR86 cluster bacterium TaxID=2030880 RepID=A0A2A5C881_9GAMM|nr:MAG: tRNA dihydrouridine(20/20a) synthase DusA [SAR86 cluster bacterium]